MMLGVFQTQKLVYDPVHGKPPYRGGGVRVPRGEFSVSDTVAPLRNTPSLTSCSNQSASERCLRRTRSTCHWRWPDEPLQDDRFWCVLPDSPIARRPSPHSTN